MRASKIGIILVFKAKQKAYMVSEEFCSIYCEICKCYVFSHINNL